MTKLISATAILCIFISVISFIRNQIRMRNLIKHMNHMLDKAIDGTFTAEKIDESLLSSLEFKLAHYLDAAETSAQKVRAEKESIQTLISDISHQTKTPISSLLLYCELLQEQNLDEESTGYVESINIQAQKLRFLTASLVKMSRLETGILTLHPVCGSVSKLLAKAYAQLAPKAMEKGLRFTLVPMEEDLNALFDEKWTLEALCNILDNAVKYTKQGGITIKVNAYELFCCIEILDTGIGIKESEQAQVFSRFYRSKETASQEGVGIGLYLAREIIMNENGYIKLISNPKEGSSFSVYLPIDRLSFH